MDSMLETIAKAASPWYITHWRLIAEVVIIAALGGQIWMLQTSLTDQEAKTKTASDALIAATAKFESKSAQMLLSIQKQNDAIAAYELAAKDAKVVAQQAASKGATVRAAADKQVQQILTKDKPVGADAAVTSLVDAVVELQWDQIK